MVFADDGAVLQLATMSGDDDGGYTAAARRRRLSGAEAAAGPHHATSEQPVWLIGSICSVAWSMR